MYATKSNDQSIYINEIKFETNGATWSSWWLSKIQIKDKYEIYTMI